MMPEVAFWKQVGQQAQAHDVQVGDAIRIELVTPNGTYTTVSIVTEAWDDPRKGRQVKLRDATDADVYDPEEIITVVAQ